MAADATAGSAAETNGAAAESEVRSEKTDPVAVAPGVTDAPGEQHAEDGLDGFDTPGAGGGSVAPGEHDDAVAAAAAAVVVVAAVVAASGEAVAVDVAGAPTANHAKRSARSSSPKTS